MNQYLLDSQEIKAFFDFARLLTSTANVGKFNFRKNMTVKRPKHLIKS